jgi:PAS domain S-box-containing protein
MNLQTLERVRQQLQIAIDSMPQLICLVADDGRVIRANRTVDRWKLGAAETARGLYLHDVLHVGCSDPACYLRLFWRRATTALLEDHGAECNAWDPILRRHFLIHASMPSRAPEQEASSEEFFVVTVDDVTGPIDNEDESRPAAQIPCRRIENRARVEPVQSHMRTILDRSPDLVAIADHSGALFYLNPAGRALLELSSQDDIAGMTICGCHAPGMRDCLEKEAMPHAKHNFVWAGESILLTRDGREIKTFLTLIAHRDRGGEIENFSLLERDMSQWKMKEEALRVTEVQLQRLSAQHLTVQETERQRIASDLHDGLGQSLVLLKLSIEQAARSLSAAASKKTAEVLEQLVRKVKHALAEMRRISMNLRPSMLDDLGILATLAWFFREFETSGVNTRIEREIRVSEADVPPPLRIAIFRILQEATNNTVKHAYAERIKVSLCKVNGAIEFSIEDDGKGFDSTGTGNTGAFNKGLGLQSMRERAELSGGSYDMESAPGKGTKICVRWPFATALKREFALRRSVIPRSLGSD